MRRLLYEGMPLSQINPACWRTRFEAWWEGFDLRLGRYHASDASRELAAHCQQQLTALRQPGSFQMEFFDRLQSGAKFEHATWTPERIKLAELMWGRNNIDAGAACWIARSLRALPMNRSTHLLDMTAGLGGVMLQAAKRYGTMVDGVEQCSLLVSACAKRLKGQVDPERVTIRHLDPDNFEIDRRYDFIVAFNLFFMLPDKKELCRFLTSALKPHGQLVFTDFFIDLSAHAGNSTMTAWRETERQEPFPCTFMDTMAGLAATGFEVRTAENISQHYRRGLRLGLVRLRNALLTREFDETMRQVINSEVALLTRRIRAIDAGLEVRRIHAIAPERLVCKRN